MKKHILLVSILSLNIHLFSIAPKGFFGKFPNKYFVETGSLRGDGIKMALRAQFQDIRSIELSSKYAKFCRKKFKNNPQVKIYHGDSGKKLLDVISDIQEPITFWLDGHYSGSDTALGDSYSPIIRELEQIKSHPINTHTIIIDDVRQFGTKYFDFVTLQEVKEFILTINPEYHFQIYDGFKKGDILVAYID